MLKYKYTTGALSQSVDSAAQLREACDALRPADDIEIRTILCLSGRMCAIAGVSRPLGKPCGLAVWDSSQAALWNSAEAMDARKTQEVHGGGRGRALLSPPSMPSVDSGCPRLPPPRPWRVVPAPPPWGGQPVHTIPHSSPFVFPPALPPALAPSSCLPRAP